MTIGEGIYANQKFDFRGYTFSSQGIEEPVGEPSVHGRQLNAPDTFRKIACWSILIDQMPVPEPLVTRSDEVLSGAVVFAGTRVPVQTLLDYLEEGDTLDHFLEDFPTVSREHAIAVLELAKESVFSHADSAG